MEWRDNPNKKAIATLRVSSHRQKDNTSHEVQETEIKKYAEEFDFAVEVVRIVESAKDAEDRAKYHAAVNRALKNGVRHFLYYMTDREGRNFTDLERMEKLIRQDKVVVHYVRDRKVLHRCSPPSDFSTREIEAWRDKQLSRTISVKVNDAQLRKAVEDKCYPGNHPPLGYAHQKLKDENGKERKRGTRIVPDPDTRRVRQVQREFELRALGYSVDAIRTTVIAEGFLNSTEAKRYHSSVINARLKNRFYWGFFTWQGVEYEGNHELIIPERVLRAVVASFGRRGLRPRPLNEQGIFSGSFLTCGDPECGCAVVYDPKKKLIKETGMTKVYPFYRCSNSRKVHQTMKGMNVTEENIWRQFEPAVGAFSLPKTFADQVLLALREAHEKSKATVRRQIEEYRNALKELEVKEDRFYDDLRAGIIDEITYQRRIKRVREERDHFTTLMAQANEAVGDAFNETAESLIELATDAKELWKSATPEQKRLFNFNGG